ncbi:hypothetical protein ACLB2K_058196 [Fragaria x ananassa]
MSAQAGVSNVVIEGDAQNVFAALDDTQEDFSFDGGILDEAKVLLRSFQVCSWGYVPRSCNKAAHRVVAREALAMPYPTYWWLMEPDRLSSILVLEASS